MPDPSGSGSQLQGIIKRLLELTQQGAIHWARGSRRSVEPFSINLTESTIRLRSRDDDQAAPYLVQILNDEGILIETIQAETEDEIDMLSELYRLARREALRVDDVISSVLRELNDETKSQD